MRNVFSHQYVGASGQPGERVNVTNQDDVFHTGHFRNSSIASQHSKISGQTVFLFLDRLKLYLLLSRLVMPCCVSFRIPVNTTRRNQTHKVLSEISREGVVQGQSLSPSLGYSTGHSRSSSLTDLSHQRNTSSSSNTSCGCVHPHPTQPHQQGTPTKPERPPLPSVASIMSNRSSR